MRRLQELDDFNDEVAGRNTGKMRKSGGGEADSGRNDTLDVMDAMELASMVWNETFDRVFHRLDILDEANRQALQEAQEELNSLQNQATVLPDGRRVYLSRDGKEAYYEDGSPMSKEDMGAVQWRPGAPSWEDRQETAQRIEEIQRYQQRLDAARQRLQSARPETLSQEELEQIESDLDRDAPPSVRQKHDRLMAERPEPTPRAAAPSKAEPDLSLSDVQSAPSVALPRVAMPSPG